MVKWEPIRFMYAGLEQSSEPLFEQFIDTFGFDQYMWNPWPRNFGKFLWGDRSYNAESMLDKLPPYKDHACAFKVKGTTKIMYVFHPYYYPEDHMQQLEQYCNDRDLIYIVCPKCHSFYCPGEANMVMLMSNDTYIDYLSIPGFPTYWERNF